MDYNNDTVKAYMEAYFRVAKRFGPNVADELFPELAESNDEKIRRTLIDFFQDWHKTKSHCWSVPIPDILSWLEKQKVSEDFRLSEEDEVTLDEVIKHLDWNADYRLGRLQCTIARDLLISIKEKFKGK